MIAIKHVRGHVEVYDGTQFLFSADTEQEANKELEELQCITPNTTTRHLASSPSA